MSYKIKFLKSISKMNITENDAIFLKDAIKNKLIDEEVLSLVCSHKLHNLLYKHINSLKMLFNIKKSIALLLSERFIFTQNRAEEYFKLLSDIVLMLSKYNINYAFLKGISIVKSLYADKEFIYRSFNDIDILVEKENVSVINDILLSMGFVQGYTDENYKLKEADRKAKLYWSLNSHQEHIYLKESSFTRFSPWLCNCIDVNTTIFQGGKSNNPISTSEILKHNRCNQIINNFFSLDYSYELLQLCYHFHKDTFIYEIKKNNHEDYSLIQFCDLREYILKYRNLINWNEFITIINNNCLGDIVYNVLFLIDSFYGDINIKDIIDRIQTTKKSDVPDWEKVLL